MDTHTISLQELQAEAQQLRRDVIEMAYGAGSGHCGGSLSCAEILVTLYRRVLKVRPREPEWPQRDRFILSKGHAAPALYALLADLGYFPRAQLQTLRRLGSILQGHPDMRKTPGVEMSSGSLGMGISNGIGMAWAARRSGADWRTFVLCGDGELDEGQNWEAAMLADKLKLRNFVVIVDHNGVQLDGTTEEIMPLGSLEDKFRAFGWSTDTCDGHDCDSLAAAFDKAAGAGRPHVIIARTVKGKGASFMEGDHAWHGSPLDEAHYRTALADLDGEDR